MIFIDVITECNRILLSSLVTRRIIELTSIQFFHLRAYQDTILGSVGYFQFCRYLLSALSPFCIYPIIPFFFFITSRRYPKPFSCDRCARAKWLFTRTLKRSQREEHSQLCKNVDFTQNLTRLTALPLLTTRNYVSERLHFASRFDI